MIRRISTENREEIPEIPLNIEDVNNMFNFKFVSEDLVKRTIWVVIINLIIKKKMRFPKKQKILKMINHCRK